MYSIVVCIVGIVVTYIKSTYENDRVVVTR